MDSKSIPVKPTSLQLDFSKNSMTNAVLTAQGRPMYTVSTLDNAGNRTEIKDAESKKLLVTIKRRTFFSDKITFTDNGEQSFKLNEWMTSIRLGDGSNATMIETGAGRYYWKTHVVHRFALYNEYNPDAPLAYMIISSPLPSIVMESGTEHLRHQILASLLIVEQKMRLEEKFTSIADGYNADNRTVFGMSIRT